MWQFYTSHRLGLRLLIFVSALTALFGFLSGRADAQSAQIPSHNVLQPSTINPPTQPQANTHVQPGSLLAYQHQVWSKSLVTIPPPKKGCFTASYPDKTWTQVPCKAPPNHPYSSNQPYNIGGGGVNDFSAQASGLISSAIGSFDSVSDDINESGPIPPDTKTLVNNAYSLQLNTNTFTSPVACAKAGKGAPCQGWEQFIFANEGDSAGILIQYWLLSYDNTCPSTWTQETNPSSGEIDCWKDNTTGSTPVPPQPVSNLTQISVLGNVSSSSDSMIMLVGATAYLVTGDNLVNAAQGWQVAEFNIFGDGDLSMATFGPRTTMVVRTAVNTISPTAPACVQASFTGETNNLHLSGSPPVATAAEPSIVFTQTNNYSSIAPAGCATAAGLGYTQQLVSGQNYVDFAKDQTGLSYYTIDGAMCVVHHPSCPSNAFTAMFGVGHNGKDKFFPPDLPLPVGVSVDGVMYTAFWPSGIDHTDRGGVGSAGSYGADADSTIKNAPPLFTVHWQNACQNSPQAQGQWAGLPLTYQVSFVISVPKGVAVKGAVPLISHSGPICRIDDRPVASTSNIAQTTSSFLVNLSPSPPSNGGYLPWFASFPASGLLATSTPITSWIVQSISNPNNFDVFLLKSGAMSDECFKSGSGQLIKKNQSFTSITSLYGSVHPPLYLVACTTGSVPSGVALSIKYAH